MVTPRHVSRTVYSSIVVLALACGCTFSSSESDGFPSVAMQQAKATLRPYKLMMAETEAELEEEFDGRDYPTVPRAPRELKDVARIEKRSVGDFEVLQLRSRERTSSVHVLFLHGGGYTYELSGPHLSMLAGLIERTGISITVPIYPLAPEFTHADAFPFVEEVYRELLEETPATNVVLGGDSAGGGFVLSQLYRYRELGLELPSKVFLISPWVDVTMSHPDIPALEGADCILVPSALRVYGEWWADDADPASPQFSPLFGDLDELPPVLMIGGTAELLLPDMRDLAGAIGAERVQVRDPSARAVTDAKHLYLEYPGGFHDFPLLNLLPETHDSLDRIAAFVEGAAE